jgi:hypothetical protein
MRKRFDTQKILKDPALRKKLRVPLIKATQNREGVITTIEQAEAAYNKVQEEKNNASDFRHPNPGM